MAKRFDISFIGREAGAIGITYRIHETVEAEDAGAAILKLYKKYDHIKPISINGVSSGFSGMDLNGNMIEGR